jgi:hypothetical protein
MATERKPIPTGHKDYEITPEKEGYAVVHKTNADHGGMGAVRFAKDEVEAHLELAKMMKANGDI